MQNYDLKKKKNSNSFLYLQGTSLPPGVRQVHGSQLHFPSVDVDHAGVYQCIAENDVGRPANATFILNVHCKYRASPMIMITKKHTILWHIFML